MVISRVQNLASSVVGKAVRPGSGGVFGRVAARGGGARRWALRCRLAAHPPQPAGSNENRSRRTGGRDRATSRVVFFAIDPASGG